MSSWSRNTNKRFDATIKISVHHIRATDPDFIVTSIMEVKDA
jgi:hypothetical protein